MSKKFFIKAGALDHPRSGFRGFHPGTNIFPKGMVAIEGHRPLATDIVQERDYAVPMRDGVKVRVDVYRPNHDKPVPVILVSSIFGKNGSFIDIEHAAKKYGHPNRCGITRDMTSGLEAWETPDPGYWVPNDYAVVLMDPRGVGMSEGNATYFGAQDASDNYDCIEHIASLPWCNGKVSMAGNSWLAITQWYTAALKPPHLACIAPWEGHGNMYVDQHMRGGIPHINGVRRHNMCHGSNMMEDLTSGIRAYPLMNDYWEDMAADFHLVETPAYVVASYTSQLHCRGTFEGYRTIASKEKWLRVHNTQEWTDQYTPEYEADLLKFFDYYMKDIKNDWPDTPKVRMSVLDPGHTDVVNRPEEDYPLARQQFKKFYLNPEGNVLDETCPAQSSVVSYQGDDGKGMVQFSMTFQEDTEISGYCKLHLWVSTDDYYDMDVYAKISTKNADGEYLFHDGITQPYSGPNAMLRASLRELDVEKSTESEPIMTFKTPDILDRGVPVCLELGFWPTSLLFHAGETLCLTVAGFDFQGLSTTTRNWFENYNVGRHNVHVGGEFDSYLLLPFIPEQ